MQISGFCDLNLLIQSDKTIKDLCETLVSLNYKVVAFNHIIEEEREINEDTSKKKKKKKGGGKDIVPLPAPVNIPEELKKKLQIFHRLTITFSQPQFLQKVNLSQNIKKYDLISVIPTTLDAFQLACSSKDVDLISFDASNKSNFRFNRKMYNVAISQNIYFEVPYSPATLNSTSRRNTIQMAHICHTNGKSKNIIMSSGARNPYQLRGPYDVVNLGLLFGLSEEQSKSALTNNCRNLLIRSQGRKFGKASMTMMISDLDLQSDETSDEGEEEPSVKRSRKEKDFEMDQ